MNKKQWLWGSSHQKSNKSASESIVNFVRQLAHNFLLPPTPVILKVKIKLNQTPLKYTFISTCHHAKFEQNRFINVQMHVNVNVLNAVCKTAVIFCFYQPHSKISSGCSAGTVTAPCIIPSWSTEWRQQVLICADLETPNHGECHRKWYKIVEVKCACKQSRNENIWLRSCV